MAEVKCYKCGVKYEENPKNKDMHPKQCPDGCKQKETIVEKNIKPKKINKIDKNYKYPALEFVISIYKILGIIIAIVSFIGVFYCWYYAIYDISGLDTFLTLFGCFIGVISLYASAELFRIFIRIEENTRK